MLSQIIFVLVILTSCTGITLNFVTLTYFVKTKRRKFSRKFLIALSGSDIVVCTLIPWNIYINLFHFNIHDYIYIMENLGNILEVNIVLFILILSPQVVKLSGVLTLFISSLRLVSVHYPLYRIKKKLCTACNCILILFGTEMALILIFLSSQERFGEVFTLIICVTSLLSTLTIATSSVLIYCTIRRRKQFVLSGNHKKATTKSALPSSSKSNDDGVRSGSVIKPELSVGGIRTSDGAIRARGHPSEDSSEKASMTVILLSVAYSITNAIPWAAILWDYFIDNEYKEYTEKNAQAIFWLFFIINITRLLIQLS